MNWPRPIFLVQGQFLMLISKNIWMPINLDIGARSLGYFSNC